MMQKTSFWFKFLTSTTSSQARGGIWDTVHCILYASETVKTPRRLHAEEVTISLCQKVSDRAINFGCSMEV